MEKRLILTREAGEKTSQIAAEPTSEKEAASIERPDTDSRPET
jgi:hypothetical protein